MVSYVFLALILMQWSSVESKMVSQNRWCPVSVDEVDAGNKSSSIKWASYDDSRSICVSCGNTTQLFVDGLKNDTFLECCDGKLDFGCSPTSCASVVLQCSNSSNSYCFTSQQCDGYNQCGNGYDEVRSMEATDMDTNCNKACDQGQYQCSAPPTNLLAVQCFTVNHVCDGIKDCFTGSDEENCAYYGGRCPGFRCLTLPQCLPDRHKVCDGRKDCLDGSDELGCMQNHMHCTTDYFMCQAKHTLDRPWTSHSQCTLAGVVKEKVCDGNEDCLDGKDEENCFTWSQWSAWKECDCSDSKSRVVKSGIRLRNRKCFTFHDIMNHHKDKCSVDVAGAVEYKQCECVDPTTSPAAVEQTTALGLPSNGGGSQLSETVLIVIILSVVIIIVIIACGLYTLCINQQRKADIIKLQHQQQLATQAYMIGGGADSICGVQPSVGASSIISSHYITSPLAAGSLPTVNNRTSMGALFQGNSLYRRPHQAPLPPTPTSDSLYASIDEMNQQRIDPYAQTISPLSKRSMSLVSIDEIANPQELAETPYDIPRNDHENKPRSKKKAIRLIRAISRKMSIARTPSHLRRALSNDQLNHNFASTRNLLLKSRNPAATRRQLADIPDDPQSNYMTMCGTPADTISMRSRGTIDLTEVPPPPPPGVAAPSRQSIEDIDDAPDLPPGPGRSDSFRRANKSSSTEEQLPPPINEGASTSKEPGSGDDDSSIKWMKDEEVKEDLYSRVIPKSLRRKESKAQEMKENAEEPVTTTDL